MKGLFITFEGSEGSGKSTQSRMLYQYLKRKKHKVIYLREPGGTAISEKIRQILLDARNDSMSGACEMLLYMAARAQLVREVIRPALAKGAIVICDRFLDSTLAYQGYGLGMDKNFIRRVGRFVTGGLAPKVTIFLDLPVHKGLRHRQNAQDRIEKRPLGYHKRVRSGYLSLARREPARFKVVKVQKDKYVTQSKIRELIEDAVRRH